MGEEDREDILLDQAFTVNKDDVGDYVADDVPMNGHQYLQKVMMEAGSIPDVVVANVNRVKYDARQTVYVPQAEAFEVPQNFLPSKEWQMQQVADFDDVRYSISMKRNMFVEPPTLEVPELSDKDDVWHNFIFESEWKEPLLKNMLAVTQDTLEKVLQMFSYWLEEGTIEFNGDICLRLYSILACLEIPLPPSRFAELRALTQLAIKHRADVVQANASPCDEQITRLNLLICIVGRYFKQTDLADDYY